MTAELTHPTVSPAQSPLTGTEPALPAAAPARTPTAGQGTTTTSRVLAIDPGDTESAYVVIDHTRRPMRFGKRPNHELLDLLHAGAFDDCEHTAIEMIASYGMPVGAEVFDTCVWIGRFLQIATLHHHGPVQTVKRHPVKLHHCHDSRAKDSNIIRALVDRFAPGESNYGKGTKADPGFFYGFKADVWQAYALAVYVADTTEGRP